MVLDGAPQPSLQRPPASQQYLAALPAALLAELNPKENLWGKFTKSLNYPLKSIDAVRAKLKQAILYIERNPQNGQIHHLIPLHPQVILMWKWYQNQTDSHPTRIGKPPSHHLRRGCSSPPSGSSPGA